MIPAKPTPILDKGHTSLYSKYLKAPVTKAILGRFKTDITHDCVLGISVNIPTKPFCPAMCILFVSSESCFYTFGRIDWGWVKNSKHVAGL